MGSKLSTGIRQTQKKLVERFRSRRLRETPKPEPIEAPEEILPPLRTYYHTLDGTEDEMDSEIYIETEPEPESSKSKKRSKSRAQCTAQGVHNASTSDSYLQENQDKRSRLKKMFCKKKPRELSETEVRIEKVRSWQRSLLPRPFVGPIPPLVATTGITKRQALVLSRTIQDAIEPTNRILDFSMGSEVKPFLMVHQTNEFEIMTTIGSYRLNLFLRAKKDTDSLGYTVPSRRTARIIHEICDNERIRRRFAYERKNKSLTLQEAYEVAMGTRTNGNKNFGIVEFVTQMQKTISCINMYPVIHSEEPVIGVPFKIYFKDIVDIPEYPPELFRAMNKFLDKFAIQIIDLRCRSEEVIGQVPYIMDNFKVGREVVDSIVRSVDALNSIRHTAKYFVVYAFYSCQLPMRYFQSVVRFKPGYPINQADWVNTKSSRNQIDEPDPDCSPFNKNIESQLPNINDPLMI